MMNEERFVTFADNGGTEHTVRLVDIQSVGVNENRERPDASYVRVHNLASPVTPREAIRVRKLWLQEG